MADMPVTASTFQEPNTSNMSEQGAVPFAFPVDHQYKMCVQIEQAEVLGSSTTNSLTKQFSTVLLPSSHPLFSADVVDVLAPFSTHSGGVPLRTLSSNDTVTLVAHASGDDLCAAQFEVLWQFKLFAQGICSAAISDTAKADILTLSGTEVAPRRNVGHYTGEDHYLGWNEEHFKKFFHEYTRSSIMQAGDCVTCYTAGNWQGLRMPRWLSAAELSVLSGPPVSALNRSLQETISATKKDSGRTNKTATHRRKHANQARSGKLPRRTGRRDQAIKKRNEKLSSNKNQGPATRPNNIYSKQPWYQGQKGADRRKDRDCKIRKQSALPPIKTIPTQPSSLSKPSTSLRDTRGLGPAISKTKKPFHSITAHFQDRKPSNEKVPLTQPVRDFIAHKIEEQMLNATQKEAILHIIRTVSPKEFNQRRNGRLIDYHNMSDRLYRQLAQFISDSSKPTQSTAATTDLDILSPSSGDTRVSAAAAQVLTPEMVQFTRENILKLSPDRLQELSYITERTVPSVDAMPATRRHVLPPEKLPVENQIMIWRYVKMHSPEINGEGGDSGASGREAKERDLEMREMVPGQGTATEENAIEARGSAAGADKGDDIEMDLDVDYGLLD
jgi:hypothetical protein